MKRGVIVLISVLLILSISFVSAYEFGDIVDKLLGNPIQLSETDCTCNSCAECTTLLSSSCTTLTLTDNIYADKSKNCINLNNPSNINGKTLDCNGRHIEPYTGIATPKNGIYLKSKSGLTIKNCNFGNFQRAIYLDSCTGVTLENNQFDLDSIGIISTDLIYLKNSNDNTINKTNITNAGAVSGRGIYLVGSSNNKIINNDIHSLGNAEDKIGKAGITIDSKSNSNNLTNNIIYNVANGPGVEILGKDNNVNGLVARNNAKEGIIISGTGNQLSNLNIENNQKTGLLVKTSGNTLTNSRVCGNYRSGNEKTKGKDLYLKNTDFVANNLICNNRFPQNTQCSICVSEETGLCNDGIDNDGDGYTDCQDSACGNPCKGNCSVGVCDPVTYQWSCQADQTLCGTCKECQQKANNEFNCTAISRDNFGTTCNSVGTFCDSGACKSRKRGETGECVQTLASTCFDENMSFIQSADCNISRVIVLNQSGASAICVEANRLCGDGLPNCDKTWGENYTNCPSDCFQCTTENEARKCRESYSDYNYTALIDEEGYGYVAKNRTHFIGFCNIPEGKEGGICANNEVQEVENISYSGDRDYCTKKVLTGTLCSRNESDCDSDSECGNDTDGAPLSCMINTASRANILQNILSIFSKDGSTWNREGCCRNETEEWYLPKGCIQIEFEKRCYKGSVYWYNEMGVRRTFVEECDIDTQTCNNGACVEKECGDDNDCQDNLDCTNNICNSTGSCENNLISGKCLINGRCYNNNQLKPEITETSCYKCDTNRSTSEWSLLNETEVCSQRNVFGNKICGEERCGSFDCGDCPDTGCYRDGSCGNDNFCNYLTQVAEADRCLGKECGDDGCGGFCGTDNGQCADSTKSCNSTGQCESNTINPSSQCADSDGGLNYTLKGNLTNVVGGTLTDSCSDSTHLQEYSCIANTLNYFIDNVVCQYGCYDGACNLCTPATCSGLGKTCGSWGNGCGTNVTCGNISNGACLNGGNCNSTGQCNICIPSTTNVCANKNCGSWTNGTCGNVTCGNNSGGCDSGYGCNSTGVCVPTIQPSSCTINSNVCSGKVCGNWINGTGTGCTEVSCGNCTSGNSCNATLGTCYSNPICSPNANVCVGKVCGMWANGTCGDVSCGLCASGNCNLTTGLCMACVPSTTNVCANKNCGSWTNGTCGNVTCGSCSGSCVNGNCSGVCTAATCLSLGKQCGSWSNLCGANLSCGSCGSGYTCNSTGRCVVGSQPCIHLSSSCAGKECGDDNCGTTDGCGSCDEGKSCEDGTCVVIPIVDCGNNVCDSGEDSTSCPDDCKKSKLWIWILIIFLILAIIAAAVITALILIKNKKKTNSGNLENKFQNNNMNNSNVGNRIKVLGA